MSLVRGIPRTTYRIVICVMNNPLWKEIIQKQNMIGLMVIIWPPIFVNVPAIRDSNHWIVYHYISPPEYTWTKGELVLMENPVVDSMETFLR